MQAVRIRTRLINFFFRIAAKPSRLGWLILLAVVHDGPAARGAPQRPPNLVVVLIDNLGKDWLGCYGSDEQVTPQIDQLASTGVRFRHCYVTPMCSTTRVAFLTGRYGFRTGWHTHHDTAIYGGGYFDWERESSSPRPLQAAGYATTITGKWQLNDLYDPENGQTDALRRHGFDDHFVWTGALVGDGVAERRWKSSLVHGRQFEGRYGDPVVFRNRKRIEFPNRFGPELYLDHLIEFMRRHRERPFLALYTTPLVHVPTIRTPLTRAGELSERAEFADLVRYVDHQVGQLIAALEELGLRENTVVMVTTDNGSPSRLGGRRHGKQIPGGLGKLTEPGLDVPLIVSWPAHVTQGRISDRLIDCTDFLPTLVELGNADLPARTTLDGHSFAADLGATESDRPERSWIFSQYASTRLVRDRQFKLYNDGQLFDIANDPLETEPISVATENAKVSAARRRLQRILDRLPADADLPFEPRSGSAFRLRREKLAVPLQSVREADVMAFPLESDGVREFQQSWARRHELEAEIDNSLHMQMVLIPPGRFQMGTGSDEAAELVAHRRQSHHVDVYYREVPQHPVTISKPFYLGTTPVTVGQFRAFVEATGYKTDAERDGRGGFAMIDQSWQRATEYDWNSQHERTQADDEPVVNVSWNDAVEFCQWLTKQEGIEYRLPTEAEWEYACRAGTATSWYSGDDPQSLESYAWYRSNSDWTVHRVAQKRANAFGLFDMHGNMRNWCSDWYDETYYYVSPELNPGGPKSGTDRVVRGAAFHYWPDFVRSATRFRDPPSHRHGQLGFRAARAARPQLP